MIITSTFLIWLICIFLGVKILTAVIKLIDAIVVLRRSSKSYELLDSRVKSIESILDDAVDQFFKPQNPN